jgi:hypothetical protein
MDADAAPAFTGMKCCINQTHVVSAARGKYSECVDDLVVSSFATRLAMNDRIASPQAAVVHFPGRIGLPLPAGFLPNSSGALGARLRWKSAQIRSTGLANYPAAALSPALAQKLLPDGHTNLRKRNRNISTAVETISGRRIR